MLAAVPSGEEPISLVECGRSVGGGGIVPSEAILDMALLRVAACFLDIIDHQIGFLRKELSFLREKFRV